MAFTTGQSYIGGDWMVHYELFIEELEEKVAPIRISQGGQ